MRLVFLACHRGCFSSKQQDDGFEQQKEWIDSDKYLTRVLIVPQFESDDADQVLYFL